MLHDRSCQILHIALFMAVVSQPAAAEWRSLTGGAAGSPPVIEVRSIDVDATEIAVTIPGFAIHRVTHDGATFSRVQVPGAVPLLSAGDPELPLLARAVRLPAGGRPRLVIVDEVWQAVAAPPPLPSRGPASRSGAGDEALPVLAAAYRSGGVWPQRSAELGDPFLVRDRRGVAVRIYPVRWRADRGELEALVRLTARVEIEAPGSDQTPAVVVAAAERTFAPVYRAIFGESAAVAKAAIDGDAPAPGTDAAERLLIVTAPDLRPAVAELAAWKRECGFTVEVVDAAELGSTAAGIHAAVHERFYQTAGLAHLLLAGAVELVPTNYGDYENAAADGLYGLVAGDDLFADVLVSRLPARNQSELRLMIERSVAYERDPQVAASWYSQAAGIAGDQGYPADYQRADWLRSAMLGGDYTAVARIYQGFGGSRAQIAEAIADGVSLVNYVGHGASTGWLSVPFDRADVHALANTAAWPWIIDVSCSTGDFTQPECFAEAWLRASHQGRPAGAVAMIAASTATSWVPPCVMQAAIVDHLVGAGQTQVGALFAAGVAAALVQYDGTPEGRKLMQQFNLFGDGSLHVRSRRPDPLMVAHASRLDPGATVLDVTAPAGSRVVVATADELLARADLAGEGPRSLALARPLRESESVRLTVTAPNAQPYRVAFAVGGDQEPATEPLPTATAVLGNWPNPCNPQTTLGLVLPAGGAVRLTLYDVRGRLVRVLVDGTLPAGSHHVVWDGRDQSGQPVGAGVYLARLVTAQGEQRHKLTVAR
ncbi:MAG: C25 family cysteine peptidase [Candidatus Krumholzibacteria bacterium]|nr:C25 family cysteine peptidase [Candidatus Krumholzibacteria bacterium]